MVTYSCHLFYCRISVRKAVIKNEKRNATDYIVKTLSLVKNPVISMGGFRVLPDYPVDDFPNEFRLLVLTGRLAWKEQKNNVVLPIVDYAVKKHIPVGAICDAANFMAENGYLDKIKHSGNTLEFMKSQAPHYNGKQNFIEKQTVRALTIISLPPKQKLLMLFRRQNCYIPI